MTAHDNADSNTTGGREISRLIDIMAALRTPDTGCPWDLVQDFKSIAPYTIEEAYEVADVIERNAMDELKDELGDLLLQVVYHARMAEEQKLFKFEDVVQGICEKMVRRHPHVFGQEGKRRQASSADDVNVLWDEIKAEEKKKTENKNTNKLNAEDQNTPNIPSLLDDIPLAMPGLTRAFKLQKKAAKVGFDWPALGPVFDKLEEEIGELSEAVSVCSHQDITEEIGDVLFSVTNLARHMEIDPEAALRATNQKFRRRFQHIEQVSHANNKDLANMAIDEMEALWKEAKLLEKKSDTED